MRYLLLIYNNPATEATGADLEAVLQGHAELHQELKEAGTVISSASLSDPAATTTVRVEQRSGAAAVTDGPFLETKEYLAGYYLVECDTQEQAIKIARRIPCGLRGAIEVRPVNEAITRTVLGKSGDQPD